MHELGHVLMIKKYAYKIVKVEIYPFGGITTVDKPINTPLKEEMMIAISGVLMQIGLQIFMLFWYIKGGIAINTYSLFSKYNGVIFFFNLLPIIPLDGSIFMHSFLEKWLSYEKALFWYDVCSCFFFLLFLCSLWFFHLENYFICGILIGQFFLWKKQEPFLIHRFYLERHLYEFPYRKICSHEVKDIHKLRKETLHFFKHQDYYIPEKELLREYFS